MICLDLGEPPIAQVHSCQQGTGARFAAASVLHCIPFVRARTCANGEQFFTSRLLFGSEFL